jgi:preprotein translocase subunit SecE
MNQGEESVSQEASAEKGPEKDKDGSKSRLGLVARIQLFFRQVIAELRKVIWPTRKELITYTIVVLVFSSIFAAIVVVLDVGFGKLNFWIFG